MILSLNEIEHIINTEWDRKPHIKIEWLKMENIIRSILQSKTNNKLSDAEALQFIDESIAAFTGRGSALGIEWAGEDR